VVRSWFRHTGWVPRVKSEVSLPKKFDTDRHYICSVSTSSVSSLVCLSTADISVCHGSRAFRLSIGRSPSSPFSFLLPPLPISWCHCLLHAPSFARVAISYLLFFFFRMYYIWAFGYRMHRGLQVDSLFAIPQGLFLRTPALGVVEILIRLL
jgi:hypothetical protein